MGWTPTVKREYSFDGDTIEVVFRRLRMDELLAISAGREGEALDINDPTSNIKVLEAAAPTVGGAILSSTWPHGDVEQFREFLREMYASPLLGELFRDLVQESQPPNPNSSGPESGDSSGA